VSSRRQGNRETERSEQRPSNLMEIQNTLRIRAAWLYYVEGHTQGHVADLLGVSRVTVTRLLSQARQRGEVTIRINAAIAATVELQRKLERIYDLNEAIVTPMTDPEADPTRVIAASAGSYVSQMMRDNMTIGVGWGRTLHAALPHIEGRRLTNVRVISLLGGIAQARRFNPAEFAWQFAELFDAEGFLIPAPALVDSTTTRHALLEHCGLDQILSMADASDVALFSAGGISTLTTSYRLGHLSEAERCSVMEAGAVGDVLYNFIDSNGNVLDHPVNRRIVSIDLDRLRRIPKKVFVSGGAEKLAAIRATILALRPTVFITDEVSARALVEQS